MTESKMVLHTGGASATLEQVTAVPTPAPEGRWHPISHRLLYDQVVASLTNLHMRVVNERHALAHQGQRYFGLLQIANGQSAGSDYAYMMGLRNSTDRSIVAGLAVGSRVFVCDNLAFSAEIVIARKHTTYIERDLPVLTARAVGQLSSRWTDMDNRFKAYREYALSDVQVHDLTIRALDLGAITSMQIPHVLDEWRHPSRQDFAMSPKTAWRFFNAVTEVAKGTNVFMLPRRTQALHALVDAQCGIVAQREAITAGMADAQAMVNQ